MARFGGSTDGTNFEWIGNTDTVPYTVDVSGYNYLKIVLYASYNTSKSVGNYITFKKVMLVTGDTPSVYYPKYYALDFSARSNIDTAMPLYKHFKFEKGGIASGGALPAYNPSTPRIRTVGIVKLNAGDTVMCLVPKVTFAAHLYLENGTWVKEATTGWSGPVYTIPVTGFYKFAARYDTGTSDAGMNDTASNYTPFFIVYNSLGAALYKWHEANGNIQLVLHRGMALLAPENTIPAFRLSSKYGFETIETDVWFTSDGYPVLCHDATVDRTSNGSGTIADMTLAQLKALDFGSWFSAEYAGTTIPTLEEAIIDAKTHGYKLQIEPKEDWTVDGRAEAVVALIVKYGMEKSVTIAGFNGYNLIKVHQLNEYIDLGRMTSAIDSGSIAATLDANIKGSNNETFMIVHPASNITADGMALALAAHLPVMASITNTVDGMVALANLGIRLVTTDAINLKEAYHYTDI